MKIISFFTDKMLTYRHSLFNSQAGSIILRLVPFLWLFIFFTIPFLIVLKVSVAEIVSGIPPFTPLLEIVDETFLQIKINFANYLYLFEESLYFSAYLSSLKIAGIATIGCLLIGYPMAYAIARAQEKSRTFLLLMIMLPFWTSFLIRVYAWIGILKEEGLLNLLLLNLGLISEPLHILHTDWAVYIGLIYSYLPFMILPLYATLEKMDYTLLEAASDLGCRPFKAFLKVTLPLSIPGIIAGSMLVFIPAVGEFLIPDLLGGPDTLMIGKILWQDFFTNRDWPMASSVAVAMLFLLVLPILLFQKQQAKKNGEKL